VAADGDTDGDGDQDLDGDPPVDADQLADADPWEGGIGCDGELPTDERWVVAVRDGEELRSYRTGRDCADPQVLCTGCTPVAISPSGDRAVAVLPGDSPWPMHHGLALVQIEPPIVGSVEPLGIYGARASWIDDDRFIYLAPSELDGDPAPCEEGEPPKRNDVMLYDLGTHSEVPLHRGVRRAWRDCCPIYFEEQRWVLLPVDYAASCNSTDPIASFIDVAEGRVGTSSGSDGNEGTFLFGLWPDGRGALLAVIDHSDDSSHLYLMHRSGAARRLYGDLAALDDVGAEPGIWYPGSIRYDRYGECASVRRLGPACEFYCHTNGDEWLRLTALGDEPEALSCMVRGQPARIMDVWQR